MASGDDARFADRAAESGRFVADLGAVTGR